MSKAVVERKNDEHSVSLIHTDYRMCLFNVGGVVSVSQENTLRVCSCSRSIADVGVVIWTNRLISLDEKVLVLSKELISHRNDHIDIHLILTLVIHMIEDDDLLNKRAFRKNGPYLSKLEL